LEEEEQEEVQEFLSKSMSHEEQKTLQVKAHRNTLARDKTFDGELDKQIIKLPIIDNNDERSSRKTRSFNTSKALNIIDWFSNNVVSERVRNDPREKEKYEEVVYEVIEEFECDSDNGALNKVDENVSDEEINMFKYVSGKNILGSNGQVTNLSADSDNYALESVKPISTKNDTYGPSRSEANMHSRINATLPMVSFENIDDEDSGRSFVNSTNVFIFLLMIYRKKKYRIIPKTQWIKLGNQIYG
jgi:hypothetical protein